MAADLIAAGKLGTGEDQEWTSGMKQPAALYARYSTLMQDARSLDDQAQRFRWISESTRVDRR